MVQQCQKALNDISTWHAVGLYWVLDMLGYDETKSLTDSQEAALKFVGPEPNLGVSRQGIRRRIRRWLVNQHWVWW
jgi:hypothetical protein